MKKTLKAFRFDQKKSGDVLMAFVMDCPKSQHQIAEEIGMSDDALSHTLHGRNKDLHLERAFKICVATGHSICEYIRLMLQDEDIDFADRIHVLRAVDMQTVKYLDYPDCADTAPLPVPIPSPEIIIHDAEPFGLDERAMEVLRQDREGQMDRLKGVHDRYTERLVEQFQDQIRQLHDSREITIRHYNQRIEIILAEHDKHNNDMKEAYTAAKEFLKKENKRRFWWILGLALALGISLMGILALFIYDAATRGIGWLP